MCDLLARPCRGMVCTLKSLLIGSPSLLPLTQATPGQVPSPPPTLEPGTRLDVLFDTLDLNFACLLIIHMYTQEGCKAPALLPALPHPCQVPFSSPYTP